MPRLTLPFNPRYTHNCPSCGSLATEWHPDTYRTRFGWGKCHAAGCGASWNMEDRGDPKAKIPSHDDLVQDALAARRRKMSYREAFAAYAKMKVPGVTLERFDQAWAAAKELGG